MNDSSRKIGSNNKPKVVARNFIVPFILITSLFALWGFANDITNPMVAAFQTVMEISTAKAALIQFAFYGGYGTMAIPAALFVQKYSYKKGIILGLGLYSSSSIRNFWILSSLIIYFDLWISIFRDNRKSIYTIHG